MTLATAAIGGARLGWRPVVARGSVEEFEHTFEATVRGRAG
jgi:hypothetical protein